MAGHRTVKVELGPRSYDVCVGPGLISEAASMITAVAGLGAATVVTNPGLRGLYADPLAAGLSASGLDASVVEIPDGETSKTLATVETIYDAVLAHGGDRSTLVVAVGGGVVGDIAGFAAATALRGLGLVMVPTTLLAQVDSSVGGKTAVNRPEGKNLVGSFYQPSLVLADTAALATLPDREFKAGLAEVIKYGVILDAELFSLLENERDAVLERDEELMADIVARCCRLKAGVVARDERETSGHRAILNVGHTVGHGLERTAGYGQLLHGEAVAIGMSAAMRVSASLGACDAGDVARLDGLVAAMGLPTEIPAGLDRAALAEAMGLDKKAQGDKINFVVAGGIGQCRTQPLDLSELSGKF